MLRRIAEKGRDGFYKGPTAELLVAEMKRGEGHHHRADLDGYKAKWRTPIAFEYRGTRGRSRCRRRRRAASRSR